MSRIDDLDKVLSYVDHFSENLSNIPETELSMNSGIEIDELSEYLEELEKRGFVTNHTNGTYITFRGRMALENAKERKPFREELQNKRLKKLWSIIKIIAGALNALAIIAIAIWTQVSSDKSSDLENDYNKLEIKHNSQELKNSVTIDSLQKLLDNIRRENTELIKIREKDSIPKEQ